MNRGFSLYLDGLRAGAALLVLISHWAYERFTGGQYGWIREHDLGGDAVVVFFVLSGFVIAYTAEKRAREGLRNFAADRLSRLWSVAIPAILLVILCDPIGILIDSTVYDGFFRGYDPTRRLVTALTFTNELWFISVRPGSNGPWWSLGYEAWYYVIFACAFFLRGSTRIFWTTAAIALAGPKIWLLAPSWGLGVALWHVVKHSASLRLRSGLALIILPIAAYGFMQSAHMPMALEAWTEGLLGPRGTVLIGYSDTFLWANLLGLLFALHLLGVHVVMQRFAYEPGAGHIAEFIRWAAGGSFALYLFHYPLLQLSGAALPGEISAIWRHGLLLVLPLVGAYALAAMTERRRDPMRDRLRQLLAERPAGRRGWLPATR
ncbi:acyltransferase [Parvularcula sp. LCG005]|uniref:acyltransferase family protein n=1 Tax=Parvularcula sp. LCG005 TaxID=3078805 RepID=UPI002943DAAA|nr:acyltransferase [Parvularcula sp. LCG005]WOI53698.1 acyltransferase [Parvularcula sp. LCG005]